MVTSDGFDHLAAARRALQGFNESSTPREEELGNRLAVMHALMDIAASLRLVARSPESVPGFDPTDLHNALKSLDEMRRDNNPDLDHDYELDVQE